MAASRTHPAVWGHRPKLPAVVLLLASLPLVLASCGSGSDSAAAPGEDAEACEAYPTDDINLTTGADAGSGYGTWLQVLAPYLAEELGDEVEVIPEFLPGAGHMRGLNEVYSRTPDGSTIMVMDSGDIAMNQILGQGGPGVDLAKMTFYGHVAEGPRVWMVAADSPVDTFEDLEDIAQPVRFGANQVNPVSVLTFEEYGIEPRYILMEGTNDIALAVQRGDADVMVSAVTSGLGFLEAGDLKPILYMDSQEIAPGDPGYDLLKDTPRADDSLAERTQMVRAVVGPPNVPDCIAQKIADAIAAVNENPEFIEAAEKAELDPRAATAEEAREHALTMLESLADYADFTIE
jgi:tripartite-type tricarboxylate transporter receptor subunit TctC